MNLSLYISQIGVEKAASLFNVSAVTIYAWRNLESIPAPSKANEIIKITHGLLNWANIYQPYFDSVNEGASGQ